MIGYPEHTVAEQIHLDLPHGERIAVVGDNGQGKTTFLRTLTGSLPPLKGGARWGYGCEIGVYAQHVYTSLPEEMTVERYLSGQAAAGHSAQDILNVAGSFLFRGKAVQKPIRVLSGGERARMVLAGLFLKGHNVLVLDEPVNHLDVETAGELAEALARFPGTVIFTSHDRTFMERVATQVVEVRNGTICLYSGDYPTYVERMREHVAGVSKPAPTAAPSATAKPARKMNDKIAYRLRKKVNAVEREMDRERAAIEEIGQGFLETTDWEILRDLQARKEAHEATLEELEERWLSLHEELEGTE
jgi:ATP-binding cassette subfamily F protein 3